MKQYQVVWVYPSYKENKRRTCLVNLDHRDKKQLKEDIKCFLELNNYYPKKGRLRPRKPKIQTFYFYVRLHERQE